MNPRLKSGLGIASTLLASSIVIIGITKPQEAKRLNVVYSSPTYGEVMRNYDSNRNGVLEDLEVSRLVADNSSITSRKEPNVAGYLPSSHKIH